MRLLVLRVVKKVLIRVLDLKREPLQKGHVQIPVLRCHKHLILPLLPLKFRLEPIMLQAQLYLVNIYSRSAPRYPFVVVGAGTCRSGASKGIEGDYRGKE